MKAAYRCPSNIALVKYWGKKEGGIQLPANPSVSLTLSDLYAETSIELVHGNVSGKPAFNVLVDGAPKPSFEPKIAAFLQRIFADFTVVQNHHLYIQTSNNFPHATGIASSAAGFGALALCICDLEQQVTGKMFPDFYREASRISRLGSGSACRSLYAQPGIWGSHGNIENSSDEYAIPFTDEIAAPLNNLMDAVLIVDAGEKKVSSTEGHSLLAGNPYAHKRFEVATQNLQRILDAMRKGSVRTFISIVESEALQLHAMMMVSSPYYLLMRPNTLAVIEKIWEFREKSGLPLMFTLDAGANVHLLFPEMYRSEIVHFIENELLVYCQNGKYLCSATGKGPAKLEEC